MKKLVTGLHHVTAYAADVQATISFYAGFMGLRLVKQTVNYNAPSQYHLYFGNATGEPGTLLSFLINPALPPGRIGSGQAIRVGFSVAANSLEFWLARMKQFDIPHSPVIATRWHELYIKFEDFEGLPLELVANGEDNRKGWSVAGIPQQHAIKGLYNITFCIRELAETATLLTGLLQYQPEHETTNHLRFKPQEGTKYSFLDVYVEPFFRKVKAGSGTFHHLAIATQDERSLKKIQELLKSEKLQVTTVFDCTYFHSASFCTPSGLLIELATELPGFLIDENEEELGRQLQVPKFLKGKTASLPIPPTLQLPD